MRIDVNERRSANDDFRAFAQASVAFATFHPHLRFEDCRLELYLRGPGAAGCGLSVVSDELGPIEVNAVGEDPYDVVTRAADLLGDEVNRRIEQHEETRPRPPLSVGRVPQLPLHSASPTPQPTSTTWSELR